MEVDEKILKATIAEFEREKDHYYWTVYLQIGLMDFFDKKKEFDFDLITISKKMSPTNGDEDDPGKPDVVLQSPDNLRGILIEIKSAYPESEIKRIYAVSKDEKQLKLFDKNVDGWRGTRSTIDDYCIVLMPFQEQATVSAIKIIKKDIEDSKLILKHPFTVWYWAKDSSMKSREILKIWHSGYGKGIGWKIGEYLDEDNIIEIDLVDLFSKYDEEKYRFGRDPPSNCLYTILQIHGIMGGALRKETDSKIICTVEEVMALSEKFFPTWIPDDEKKSQLRKGWVKNALDALIDIELAEKKPDGKTYEWIEPNNCKDFGAEVVKRMAKKEIERKGFVAPISQKEEITNLNEFSTNG